jgi:polyisoprenoid-binding protein YceI
MASMLAISAGQAAAADEYHLDASHTSVEFAVKHMVITNVKGSFPDVSGVIMYDAKDITKSSVDVTIKAASVNTNNEKRDDHLRSPDFFDVGKYPDITFKSERIEKTDGGFVMTGILTIRDVSKEVSMKVDMTDTIEDPYGNVRFGAETELKINRQDFGITWNNVLDNGGLVVGNDVKIGINLEAVRKK